MRSEPQDTREAIIELRDNLGYTNELLERLIQSILILATTVVEQRGMGRDGAMVHIEELKQEAQRRDW